MLDAALVDAFDRSPRSRVGLLATPRRRALLACLVAVLLLHGGFMGAVGGLDIGTSAERVGGSVSVRTIAAAAPPVADSVLVVDAAPPEPATPMPMPMPMPVSNEARRPRQSSAADNVKEGSGARAGARIDEALAAPEDAGAKVPAPMTAVVEAPAAVASMSATPDLPSQADPGLASSEAGSAPASSPADSGAAPSLLAAGETPPPVYRTRLPPSATLRYQVRRGFLRGTGEIRWQASGETYRLVLEARIAGLTLLIQTSEGAIDATGLAPRRFVDQRARRPAQAANFRRDIERITFSGPAVEWPLLAGSQDRLSWMIQLAGIAAADPGLVVEGGRITMVVVGARGEASVWTMRSAGHEDVETARGTVRAVKLVREGHSLYDTHAEIWLDPERDYLPAHATLRNSAGASEYDLLLDRVEPAS